MSKSDDERSTQLTNFLMNSTGKIEHLFNSFGEGGGALKGHLVISNVPLQHNTYQIERHPQNASRLKCTNKHQIYAFIHMSNDCRGFFYSCFVLFFSLQFFVFAAAASFYYILFIGILFIFILWH